MKNRTYLLLFLIGTLLFAINAPNTKTPVMFSEGMNLARNNTPTSTKTTNPITPVDKTTNTKEKIFKADIAEGIIGTALVTDVDDAYDNIFHITILSMPLADEMVYLEYDLYGVEHTASVPRSFNNYPSTGGHFIKKNKEWHHQTELLSTRLLKKGDNTILFTAPNNTTAYKVKNIKIVYRKSTTPTKYTLLKNKDILYIKGHDIGANISEIIIDGHPIDASLPEFEVIIDAKKAQAGIDVKKITKEGKTTIEYLKQTDFTEISNFNAIAPVNNSTSKTIDPKQIDSIGYTNFLAKFPMGALEAKLPITARGLRAIDIAPLNASMVNVTKDFSGFRMLPHGTQFSKEVQLRINYDEKHIPEGYTAKDINVYYFDEFKRSWTSLPKDTLLVSSNIIVAKTTHFTDFIAGIIKLPESPETSGYTPTSIKDLKAASPLVGIQSIAPPSANGRGTASTGFGIAIPSGRSGMQPSFNLQYDSDGGYSWTGMGWDISVPAVSIDTRWGAPRYDTANETETYAIAGEQLIPNTHRAAWISRTGDKQFYPRREGAFQQIIRKGSSPKNYYWVVKDKSGIASYYGGTTSGLADNGILQDASGNIGHWALCLQVDLKGNTIQYEYDKRDGDLYLKKVFYTGFGTEKGNYSVSFIKNADLGEANRPDVQVSARLGFKQKNNQLLRKIEVRYKNQMVRSYELNYTEGAFKKTLLKSISEYDSESKLFYTNTLDYFDDVRDASGNYVPFGDEEIWTVESDNLSNPFIPVINDPLFSGHHTLAGSSSGTSKGVNYRLAIGLGTQMGSLKNFTVGGHGGNSWGTSDVAISLEDIDGDGLPDKIFQNGNEVFYRKNLSATGEHSFGAPQTINISSVGFSKSTSFNWGVDLNLKYGNIGYDQQTSKSKTKIYFMDFNGDGLTDFVKNGNVYYNRLVNGVPTFVNSSAGTPAPVSGFDNLQIPGFTTITEAEVIKNNPLHDVVRMWQAPATGIINIQHEYRLIEDTSSERVNYINNAGLDKADGVHLFVQKAEQLLWDEAIGATDYTTKTKQDNTIVVQKGQRLYFRVSAVYDGNYDKVYWNPTITYQKITQPIRNINGSISNIEQTVTLPLIDANNLSLNTYQASTDFFATSSSGVVVPANGNITLSGILNKPLTSDHITLKITAQQIGVENPAPPVVLFSKTFLAQEVSNFNLTSIGALAATKETLIQIELESATNINWHSVTFNPTITLPPVLGASAETKTMNVSHTLYHKRTGNYLIEGNVPTTTEILNLSIHPTERILATSVTTSQPLSDYDGEIILSAKQNNNLLARKRFNIVNGELIDVASLFDDAVVYPFPNLTDPVLLEMSVSNRKSLDIIRNYPLANALDIQMQIINLNDVNNTSDDEIWTATTDDFSTVTLLDEKEKELTLLYRNWGGFVVNGNLASNVLDEALLKPSDAYDNAPNTTNTDPDAYEGQGYEVSESYFMSLTPQYNKTNWVGLEETIAIQEAFMGVSRLGEDDLTQYTDLSAHTVQGGRTMALEMVSESQSKSISTGAGVGPLNFGYSKSIDGDSYVTETMSDFNGDRFPDYIRGGQVQLTSPTGGSNTNEIINLESTAFSHSKTASEGPSFGGSYSHGSPSNSMSLTISKASVKFDSGKVKAGEDAKDAGNSISVSGSAGTGEDEATMIHSDINGDGLPDKIYSNGEILLNTGYGFLPSENWNINGLNSGHTKDFSLGLGYSIKSGSISGGTNYSRSVSDSDSYFVDINGDGLSDKLTYTQTGTLVAINMGAYFDAPLQYPTYAAMHQNKATSYGFNAAFSIDILIPIPFFPLRITPTIGTSAGWSTSRTEATFNDIDGDGNLDYIYSEKEDNLKVRLSNIKRTNKLKSVTNAIGNSYVIDYELTKPTYENPNAKWVLQSVDVNDGHAGDGIDHSIAKFKYEAGYYDRREREFYGFGKIIQEQIDAADNTVFATSVQEFYNQDYFRKNILKRSYTLDKNNKIRQESENDYSFIDVATQSNVPVANLSLPLCDAKRIFIGLTQTNQKQYEADGSYLENNVFNTYDAHGNIVAYINNGNGTAEDKVTAKISYYENTSPYYGGIAKQIEVFTTDGLQRKREASINTATAEVTQIKNYSAADKAASTNLEYDGYGNLKKITGPANYKDQRATLEYTYDTEVNSHITQITDVFGYKNTMAYDYRFNTPIKTTDRNDQSTEYTLDAKGRLATIRGPYEIAAGVPYTIAYEYVPMAEVPYAKTRNYDPEHNNDIVTYTYTDGLGRVLQVKKTTSLFTVAGSADQNAFIVSGKTVYDGLGRAIESYYPTTTTVLDASFSTAVSNVNPTKALYDAVGRTLKTTLPDGSSNSASYSIADYNGIPTMVTTQTDGLGNTNTTYTDAAGKNIASVQPSTLGDLVTQFSINALGEMIQVTDTQGHVTSSSYDWLGRRVTYTHPDAGTTTTQYDLANNLTKRVTQNIKNTLGDTGAIEYEYEYNRLEEIKYPINPQNNVRYQYGDATGTAARRGRLWLLQDASGGQEFFYGKLGEVEKEIRTLRITPTDIQTYISQFEYDTWNRLQKMVYPDGEVVEYQYNTAGNLLAMQGTKEGHVYDYIKQLGYDEFEQRKYLKYGNDTETYYNYDPTLRRLQNMQVTNSTRQIMNNSYTYDVVGNVLSIKNTAPVINNTLGGSATHEYEYDELYRLKHAQATYQGEFTEAKYALSMSYNSMHNIIKKELDHTVNAVQKGYTLEYAYDDESHPNAPSYISEESKATNSPPSGVGGRIYQYDGNGNPTSYTEFQSFRKMTWDEENRLTGINDNGRIHQYTYDAFGERVIKSSGDSQNVNINGQNAATIVHSDDYTAYVSPYFVLNKGKFTKHYFEGAGRITSKLGTGTFAQPVNITAGSINYTQLTAAQQQAIDAYTSSLGVPPGPPTQQGIYATPEYTGNPYPSTSTTQAVEENQEPPEGWPRDPIFSEPGGVPGPPVQFGPPIKPDTVLAGEGFTGVGLPENDIFYYHPDHLGSTSYITTKNGSISQHVEYIAFGEILFEEHASSTSMPYLFNGKELDRETNLSYFGARYYDAKVSLWLNVDPLAEKYSNMSPYVFVANNPIKFIDPDGREIVLPKGTPIKDVYQILGSLQKLSNDKLVYSTQKDGSIKIKIATLGKGNKTTGTKLIRELNSSDKKVTIMIQSGRNDATADNQSNAGNGKGTNSTVRIDPSDKVDLRVHNGKGGTMYETALSEIVLGHELIHAKDHIEGTLDSKLVNHKYKLLDGTTTVEQYKKAEFRASGFPGFVGKDGISENSLRKEQKQKQRASYEVYPNNSN